MSAGPKYPISGIWAQNRPFGSRTKRSLGSKGLGPKYGLDHFSNPANRQEHCSMVPEDPNRQRSKWPFVKLSKASFGPMVFGPKRYIWDLVMPGLPIGPTA